MFRHTTKISRDQGYPRRLSILAAEISYPGAEYT
jgi:hypothetical protein